MSDPPFSFVTLSPDDMRSASTSVFQRDETQLAIFWRRFRKHKSAFVGLAILLAFTLLAIFAARITPGVTPETSFFRRIPNQYAAHGPSTDDFPSRILGNIAYATQDASRRSVLTEVTFGARVSLSVSFLAAALAVALGTTLGALSGYLGGWADEALMRVTDVFLSVPFLPFMAILLIFTPFPIGSVGSLILLFALLGWPSIARIVRADFLLLRQQGFTDAARAQGVATWRIIFRHLLPNALPNVLNAFTATVALFLVSEATLDFLSLGVSNAMTWGRAFATFYDDLLTISWWSIVFPGACIILTVLAMNLIGEALRDALDVRGRA